MRIEEAPPAAFGKAGIVFFFIREFVKMRKIVREFVKIEEFVREFVKIEEFVREFVNFYTFVICSS